MRVKKQCNHAGCRALVDYAVKYCSRHERKQADYDRYENRKRIGGKYFEFYQSKAWKKASRLYKIKNPCCEDCLEEGVIRKADVTDHIVELRDDFTKRLDENNFRSLCHTHHNKKTREERRRRSTLNN